MSSKILSLYKRISVYSQHKKSVREADSFCLPMLAKSTEQVILSDNRVNVPDSNMQNSNSKNNKRFSHQCIDESIDTKQKRRKLESEEDTRVLKESVCQQIEVLKQNIKNGKMPEKFYNMSAPEQATFVNTIKRELEREAFLLYTKSMREFKVEKGSETQA